MDFSQKLIQTQKQCLTLNLALNQSLNLLRMSQLELCDEVKSQLEENPLLEIDDDYKFKFSTCSILNSKKQKSNSNYDYDCNFYENISGKEENFKEHLISQLMLLELTENENSICKYIIELLNRKGFLEIGCDEIAYDLGESLYNVNQALYIVQSLEPYGVGATNLKECLILQLAQSENFNKYTIELVKNGLELLAKGKMKELKKLLGCDENNLKKYCDAVKNLNPIPSSGFFTNDENRAIIPDALVSINENDIEIILNDAIIPNVKINKLKRNTEFEDEKTCEYILENKKKASNLINSLDYRNKTLVKIISLIIKHQIGFFTENTPLSSITMTDIAEKLDVNISTVSRALNEKYILVNGEIYSLKSLLSNGLITNKRTISSDFIKKSIIKFIESEDKHNPISDDDIAKAFETLNIKISRRTIAKYRGILNIDNAYLRKQK